MNIIVCVKQVSDTGTVSYDIETGSVQNLSYVINSCDKVAMEEAITIKEKMRRGEVTALTVGPPRAEEILKRCQAMGADRVIRLWDNIFEDIDAHSVSIILARVISKLDYDLVLCGTSSDDECNSFVGACTAELLNIPYVSRVVKLEISSLTNKAVCSRALERGDREVVECPLPALLAVDKRLNKPRYVSIKRTKTKLRNYSKLDSSSIESGPENIKPMTRCLAISQPKPRLKKGFTIDSNLPASERMKLILSGGLEKKEEKIINKPPEKSASQLLEFLFNNRVISK
jgi:electron transfer flavoprotein beta subunit